MNKRTITAASAGAIVVSALLMTSDRRRAVAPPSPVPQMMTMRVDSPGDTYAIVETCGYTFRIELGPDGHGERIATLVGPCQMTTTAYPSRKTETLLWGNVEVRR